MRIFLQHILGSNLIFLTLYLATRKMERFIRYTKPKRKIDKLFSIWIYFMDIIMVVASILFVIVDIGVQNKFLDLVTVILYIMPLSFSFYGMMKILLFRETVGISYYSLRKRYKRHRYNDLVKISLVLFVMVFIVSISRIDIILNR